MALRKNGRGLHFPCECVSVKRGYSDPWAGIAQNKMLNNGTKERVLNSVARQPKTIAGLAEELGLSQPAVHTHVNDMLRGELLRKAEEAEKKHPAENYYEPNFPVIKASDRQAFESICHEIAVGIAALFQLREDELKQAIAKTGLSDRGWEFADVAQYCYTSAQRNARQLLEERGLLPSREKHKNGAEWLFWAEEPSSNARK